MASLLEYLIKYVQQVLYLKLYLYLYLLFIVGHNSVAVACGARLLCGVFMVYSVLLSVSLVTHAPI